MYASDKLLQKELFEYKRDGRKRERQRGEGRERRLMNKYQLLAFYFIQHGLSGSSVLRREIQTVYGSGKPTRKNVNVDLLLPDHVAARDSADLRR